MHVPNINPLQYGDAVTMNTAFNQLASGVGDFDGKIFSPGLVRPDAISLGVTGLSVGYNLPSPFGVIFGSGRFATAHGVQTNVDSQSGVANFTSLAPTGSSTITAFLMATYSGVFQAPISIPGPPPGNPGYNPNYVGVVVYTDLRDTLNITATTAAPDNITSFEIARASITSATVTLSLLTAAQVLASVNKCYRFLLATTGNITLTPAMATSLIVLSGTTATLPAISGSNGLSFSFLNLASSVASVITTGENINGNLLFPSGTVSIPLPQYSAINLLGYAENNNFWQVIGGNLIGQGYFNYTPSTLLVLSGVSGNFTVPVTVPGQKTVLDLSGLAGGGGGGGGSNGGGGGGGGAFRDLYSVAPGTIIPWSIGLGGSGGIAAAPGAPGGQTVFGPYIASGGTGGQGSVTLAASGGLGGNASGGYAMPGQPGQPASPTTSTFLATSGNAGGGGGANGLGQAGDLGGYGGVFNPSNAGTATFPGVGGGGCGNPNGSGGAGISGIIVLRY